MTYPTKKLWEICKLYQPKTISKKEMIDDWKFVVFWANWIIWRYNKFNHENEEILITCRWATCWSINISNKYSWINWNAMVSHIINKNELDFLYLFYCFKYIDFSKVISGSAQPQITRIWLVDLNIPIPPLSTQKLIVKKLDTAFKNIDESINITKKNIENIEELNESALEWIFLNWAINKIELNSITNIISWYSFKSSDFSENNTVNVLKITNVWVKNFVDKIEWKLPEVFKEKYNKFLAKKWDIVIALTRPYISNWLKVCFVPDLFDNSLVNQRVACIKSTEKSNIRYIYYFLSTKFILDNVIELSKTLNQPNLSINDLKNFQIPLPPLEKQKEIVSYLDKVFEKNKVIKEWYENKLKDLEEMKQSILKEAFEGRLVTGE